MADSESRRLGDLFKSRREKGRTGLPVMSVTINNGLVERGSLERKTDTNLSAEEHLLIKKGDIAYNMMRMWQGASGLATHDGIVSPAYIVLSPKSGIDPTFASYWFKSPRMIYLFGAYSYGLTKDRLRLYFKDFSRIPVSAPNIDDQRRIGSILVTSDKAISKINALIGVKEQLLRGVMQQLLPGTKRFKEFGAGTTNERPPEGWEFHKLGDLGSTYSGLSGKNKADFGTGTPYVPYLNIFDNSRIDPANLDYVQVSAVEKQNKVQYGDIFFTTSSETPGELGMSSVLLDELGTTYLNSFCFGYRLHSFDILIPEYARYVLRGPLFRRAIYRLAQGATRYNLSKTQLMKTLILLPQPNEQRKIAGALACIETDISMLRVLLKQVSDEKDGLLQALMHEDYPRRTTS